MSAPPRVLVKIRRQLGPHDTIPPLKRSLVRSPARLNIVCVHPSCWVDEVLPMIHSLVHVAVLVERVVCPPTHLTIFLCQGEYGAELWGSA